MKSAFEDAFKGYSKAGEILELEDDNDYWDTVENILEQGKLDGFIEWEDTERLRETESKLDSLIHINLVSRSETVDKNYQGEEPY